ADNEFTGEDNMETWAQQGNSRIGGKAQKDAVGGRFEYSTGVGVRLLYGTWNFGPGTLLVGQTYGPVNLFISNQVYGGDSDLLNFGGGIYGGRTQMLQVSFGSAKIALINPSGGTDYNSPKFEASYGFKTDMFSLTVVGGYQTYETPDIDSYALAAKLGLSLGPAKIQASAGIAQNAGSYGLWLAEAPTGAAGDVDTIIFGGTVGFKATDMLSFEGGFGYYLHDEAAGDNDGMSYYVQAVISPAPGVYIIPEIGVQDDLDDAGVDASTANTYFGAKWQINF
ncbi:MAG: hypothetical protein V3S66_01445, partial [Desulfobacterales bacterium]